MKISFYNYCKELKRFDLLDMWDKDKNKITPNDLSKKSSINVWWKCKNGHSWKDSPNKIFRLKNCPYCNHERLSDEYNFKVLYPLLSLQWDYDKNKLKPEDYFPKSAKKVWWKCNNNHSWQEPICDRIKNQECPYCCKRLLSKEYNISTLYPNVVEFWDYEKNDPINLSEVYPTSKKSYWWRCNNNHSWMESAETMRKKKACPYCTHQRVSKDYNLMIIYPNIAKLWDYDKNYPVKPSDVFPSSSESYWWKCSYNHSFKSRINSQVKSKGCPYCNHKSIIPVKEASLALKYPDIAKEWDYTKNNYTPEHYYAHSSKVVWWKCSVNPTHTWKSTISNRVRTSYSCPFCKKELKTSFPEQTIYYYLLKVYPDCKNRLKIFDREVDVYIPKINLAIEYDGMYRHSNAKKLEQDKQKETFLKSKKINFLRIKEDSKIINKVEINDNVILCKPDCNYKYLNDVIDNMFLYIKNKYDELAIKINVDVINDYPDICKNYVSLIKENSIANKFPNLISEWNYEKNNPITPYMISYGSSKRFWWKCKEGHEWVASALKRSSGRNCPYCSGRKICKSKSLGFVNPTLSKLWNKNKNGNLTTSDVSYNSSIKVWWLCKKNHEWQATVKDMSKHNNCPYCNKRKITADNNFAVLNKVLLKEWDFKKNSISPYEISKASNKMVWWKCKNGHSWQAKISNRSILKRGCPYCIGRLATKDYNFLNSYPNLAKEWDYDKNGDLAPQNVTPNSNKKVWFICENKHSWQSVINNRARGYGNCPYCKGIKACDDNNLSITNKDLIKYWNYEKNKDITPYNITNKYSKNIWWRCEKGHEWRRKLRKIKTTNKCPVCKKLKSC